MGAETSLALAPTRPLPKGPVFGWASLSWVDAPALPSVDELPHVAVTTSGRSAIYQALLQMRLAPGSTVLVPTYHCPTMVAPILLAGHAPAYFGVRPDGLPDLQGIATALGQQARAMIVSHYFGITQSLHEVREWCNARGIALIEDCAHSYFGWAGDRPVGAWGDFCTASMSKFFPVPEAGLLASAQRSLAPLHLARQSVKAQVKGCVDVVETAVRYGRLSGLNLLFAGVFKLKRRVHGGPAASDGQQPVSVDAMMAICDMARIASRPLFASRLLGRLLPRGRIITQRQRNFEVYAGMFAGLSGARPAVSLPAQPFAPYVFPVWVDDADRVYHALRAQNMPVFRWDSIWPGTPNLPHDMGALWSRHVLQMLCHQDLNEDDVRHAARSLIALLKNPTGA